MGIILRKTWIALSLLMLVWVITPSMPLAAPEQQEVPSYAKWGGLAVKEVQVKYPHARVIDYLHQGRESQRDVTIEKFKLWLQEGDREFGVFVTIEFMTESEEVIRIEFEETSR